MPLLDDMLKTQVKLNLTPLYILEYVYESSCLSGGNVGEKECIYYNGRQLSILNTTRPSLSEKRMGVFYIVSRRGNVTLRVLTCAGVGNYIVSSIPAFILHFYAAEGKEQATVQSLSLLPKLAIPIGQFTEILKDFVNEISNKYNIPDECTRCPNRESATTRFLLVVNPSLKLLVLAVVSVRWYAGVGYLLNIMFLQGPVLLYMERAEAGFCAKNSGQHSHKEEDFRYILMLQSLLENPLEEFLMTVEKKLCMALFISSLRPCQLQDQ
ncbi:unnamed protein product [Arabis nemorensis]|uniref:Uncharacterized protein n=1 Tax=Arabis nemorensis TaxID=586526 RepID=A0A565B198_9BRAS|nr:unnamed protein product [Arabis nemorensis]